MRAVVALSLLALVLPAACVGGDGDEPRAETEATATATPEPTATAAQATPTPTATPDRPIRGRRLRVEVLARGLTVPWDIAFLPDGRALVTERPGRIRLLSTRGRLQGGVVANVPTSAQGEGGLLGVAIDPGFTRGRRFAYLFVTTASGMQVQRWRWTGARLRRDGLVLGGIRAGAIHDSGRLAFGPDRNLYVATGDAGSGGLAQQRGSLNGKFLRLSPRQYRNRTSRPTILSIGHRNPQGLTWQPRSGRLFATEHGPSGFDGPSGDDEVNVVERGRNYGWPEARGRNHGGYAAPAWVWGTTVAPSGAAFVTRPGSAWTGDLLVATLKGRALHRLSVDGVSVSDDQTLLSGRYGRLRAVVEAPDGTFWVTTSNRDTYGSPVSGDDDRILRVVPPRG